MQCNGENNHNYDQRINAPRTSPTSSKCFTLALLNTRYHSFQPRHHSLPVMGKRHVPEMNAAVCVPSIVIRKKGGRY